MLRYKEQKYTPGQSLGKPEIIRDDPEVRDEYNGLLERHRELRRRLVEIQRSIAQAELNVGMMYLESCDWSEEYARLVKLQREVNAIEYAQRHVGGRIAVLKRQHYWLNGRRR